MLHYRYSQFGLVTASEKAFEQLLAMRGLQNTRQLRAEGDGL